MTSRAKSSHHGVLRPAPCLPCCTPGRPLVRDATAMGGADLRSSNLALVLGSEVDGIEFLPRAVLQRPGTYSVYFPQQAGIRSFNLANVAFGACWEAVRQNTRSP